MVLEGFDPEAAATIAPDFAPASAGVSPASLYPRIHRSRHMIVEYQEADPLEPTAEEEAITVDNSPPGTANVEPATVDTTPVGATAVTEPVVITSDVETLAASMAASAGPEIAAALGPEGFAAAAANAIARAQAAAEAPPAPLAPVEDPSATAAVALIGGRRMQQAVPNPNANVRQDILVMYTSFAATRGGGAAALENTIRTRITETNKAYADSGTNIDLVLVGIRSVSVPANTVSKEINDGPLFRCSVIVHLGTLCTERASHGEARRICCWHQHWEQAVSLAWLLQPCGSS
jgi:hypothetical protein